MLYLHFSRENFWYLETHKSGGALKAFIWTLSPTTGVAFNPESRFIVAGAGQGWSPRRIRTRARIIKTEFYGCKIYIIMARLLGELGPSSLRAKKLALRNLCGGENAKETAPRAVFPFWNAPFFLFMYVKKWRPKRYEKLNFFLAGLNGGILDDAVVG